MIDYEKEAKNIILRTTGFAPIDDEITCSTNALILEIIKTLKRLMSQEKDKGIKKNE
jgi:hypothetical protein